MTKIDELMRLAQYGDLFTLRLALEAALKPDEVADGESYDELFNALHTIDSASHRLPTFKVKHEGGLNAFVQNIVDAIESASAPPAQTPPPWLTGKFIKELLETIDEGQDEAEFMIAFARGVETAVRNQAGWK